MYVQIILKNLKTRKIFLIKILFFYCVNGVKAMIKKIQPNKAGGPDNISAKFLKETGEQLAPALTLLFQTSYNQSTIPNDW